MVSIILPAYNCEHTISEAIRSCAEQNYVDLEIIVVNDGSTDGTSVRISDYATRDKRIHVINQQNQGVTEAFNAGLRNAQGDYIARMDADDIMHPEKIMKQVAFLDVHPEIGVVSCLVNYGGDRKTQEGYARHVDWINTLISPGEILLNRFVDSPVCNPSVLFRRNLIDQFGAALNGDFPEDYEMWLRWMDAGVRFAKVPETLFTWNDLPSRLTRNDSRYSTEAFERAKIHYLVKFIQQNNPEARPVYVCGGGRITRRKSKLLVKSGLPIGAFVDIDPTRVGSQFEGSPIIGLNELPARDSAYVVNFVSVRGAREELRKMFDGQGRAEGADYIMAG